MEPDHHSDNDLSSIQPVSSLKSQFEQISVPKSRSPLKQSPASASPNKDNVFALSFAGERTAPVDAVTRSAPGTPGLYTGPTYPPAPSVPTKVKKGPPPAPPKPRNQTSNISAGTSPTTATHAQPKAGGVASKESSEDASSRSNDSSAMAPPQSRAPNPVKKEPPEVPPPRHRRGKSYTVDTYDVQSSTPVSQGLGSAAAARKEPPKPPVNRAGKPNLVPSLSQSTTPTLLTPRGGTPVIKMSPFSTPPGSPERKALDRPPAIPVSSKPTRSNTQPGGPTEGTFGEMRLSPELGAPSEMFQAAEPSFGEPGVESEPDRPPALPPRNQAPAPNNMPARPRRNSDTASKPSALSQGFSTKHALHDGTRARLAAKTQAVHAHAQNIHAHAPRPNLHPYRHVSPSPKRPLEPPTRVQTGPYQTQRPDFQDPLNPQPAAAATVTSEFPDSTNQNRRPPHYRDSPKIIGTGFDSKVIDVYGEFACCTGPVTRVWNLISGKLLLSQAHIEPMRVTAAAFKPSGTASEDGTAIWLGTSYGEIHELDLTSKRITTFDDGAHQRRSITNIFRNGLDLWTLDDEGKVFVWPAGEKGSPSLEHAVANPRLPRGRAICAAVQGQLWYATGRDIRVFSPSADPDPEFFQASNGPMTQPDVGDVTAVTYIPAASDFVLLGHTDGKISVYSREHMKCLDVFYISTYRISSLESCGRYLWIGFSTGSIGVYDITKRPWPMKKFWQAHSSPVVSICIDRNSIWRVNRLHIVSLGSDCVIGVWDATLEDDSIDDDMMSHDNDYNTFHEISTLVTTWNAGATKAADLQYNDHDSAFFRDLAPKNKYPDIMVFGLQELVDLEDKRLTAKNLLKSRHKDAYGHEHLSSVYRGWRDYLTECVEDGSGQAASYSLLHTASLVGLFTCVFVKSSLRAHISDVQASEVKTGMGGLHGNKGALIVRMLIDDSSVCLVNCHLAAGQTQTVHRNQDVHAILEAPHLPALRLEAFRAETLVGGGDGSMVTDHEICIFNGDLNYRIDTMSRETVLSAIRARNFGKLLERDQLRLSRRKNPLFRLRDFSEGEIEFAPTYKFDVGSDQYDSSDKRRTPAWCDRILFRGGTKLAQLSYDRHDMRVSDHRPVSSKFVLRVKTVDENRRNQTFLEARERFDGWRTDLSNETKLAYLTSVFGLSRAEAERKLHK